VAKRINGVWRVVEGVEVDHKGGNQTGSLTDMIRLLDGNEMSVGEWAKACEESLNMSSVPPRPLSRGRNFSVQLPSPSYRACHEVCICKGKRPDLEKLRGTA
jgi:hypothetical protein